VKEKKKEWPADKVERWPTHKLLAYQRNARTHSEEQVGQIARSMQEFGWTVPILVDEGGIIIAGHGRVLAAAKLGYPEVPVMVANGWTEAQRMAYRLADNQIPMNAGWDTDMLRVELTELGKLDFPLDLIGFPDLELVQFMASPVPDNDPDAEVEPPGVPISREGDLWVLGGHRLLCGDSTQKTHVERLCGPARPHLMVTDPPYGVEYDPDWRNRADRANGKPYGAGAIGKVSNDDREDWSDAWKLFQGDVAYTWHPASARQFAHFASLVEAGFEIRMQIIWAKQQFPIGRGHYHVKHESCWYAVRRGKTGHWQGARDQTTVWEINKSHKSETGHSTQKPIECMKRPIENNSKIGDSVYDPFCGSGTTIIAAEMTKRKCLAIDIDPAYVDVAVLRWQTFAEAEAVLEETGQTFAEVQEDRLNPKKAKRGKKGRII
jgi:DNA modification methylase